MHSHSPYAPQLLGLRIHTHTSVWPLSGWGYGPEGVIFGPSPPPPPTPQPLQGAKMFTWCWGQGLHLGAPHALLREKVTGITTFGGGVSFFLKKITQLTVRRTNCIHFYTKKITYNVHFLHSIYISSMGLPSCPAWHAHPCDLYRVCGSHLESTACPLATRQKFPQVCPWACASVDLPVRGCPQGSSCFSSGEFVLQADTRR